MSSIVILQFLKIGIASSVVFSAHNKSLFSFKDSTLQPFIKNDDHSKTQNELVRNFFKTVDSDAQQDQWRQIQCSVTFTSLKMSHNTYSNTMQTTITQQQTTNYFKDPGPHVDKIL